jgi:hypothetical protein
VRRSINRPVRVCPRTCFFRAHAASPVCRQICVPASTAQTEARVSPSRAPACAARTTLALVARRIPVRYGAISILYIGSQPSACCTCFDAALCDNVFCAHGGACDAATGSCQCTGGWHGSGCSTPLKSEWLFASQMRLSTARFCSVLLFLGAFEGTWFADQTCARSSCCCLDGKITMTASDSRQELQLFVTCARALPLLARIITFWWSARVCVHAGRKVNAARGTPASRPSSRSLVVLNPALYAVLFVCGVQAPFPQGSQFEMDL